MAIVLNHTIVPARDQAKSAKHFAKLFGLTAETFAHFDVVRINDQLSLDFASWFDFAIHHYAFHVSDQEFDEIFGRVKAAGIEYAADPAFSMKGRINRRSGGRGVYFHDLDGHVLELLTRT